MGWFCFACPSTFSSFLYFFAIAYYVFSNLLQDGLTEIFQSLIENLKSCLITCKPIFIQFMLFHSHTISVMYFSLLGFVFQGKSNGTAENYGQTCYLNKDYSCDACQKDFTSKETLNAHLGSHVQVWSLGQRE